MRHYECARRPGERAGSRRAESRLLVALQRFMEGAAAAAAAASWATPRKTHEARAPIFQTSPRPLHRETLDY